MGRFRSAAKQSAFVMKQLQGAIIKSVGTVRNYEQALTRVAEWMQSERIGELRDMTPHQTVSYLEARGRVVGQKTLDMERQAIQIMLLHVTQKLDPGAHLPYIKSDHTQILRPRAYTPEQAQRIAHAQTLRNALATEIAYATGLRAHELLTLLPAAERPADIRPALETKWQGREGEIYTVQGKGGLVREVLIPGHLAERLESLRLAQPQRVRDRVIFYTKHYNIAGGKNWSSSFSSAAHRTLGWSEGAHGLRHGYAQKRMNELQTQGLIRKLALETVSQEMGHFRAEITETYLR